MALSVSDAAHAAAAQQDLPHAGVLAHLDARIGTDRAAQRLDHPGAGGVAAGVHDPIGRVRTLSAERQLAALPVERHSEGLQDRDTRRPGRDGVGDDLRVAQPGAGDDGVHNVGIDAVLGTECSGHAALGVGGVAVPERTLGDQDHLPCRGGPQRDQKSGQPASDDNDRISLGAWGRVNGVKLT